MRTLTHTALIALAAATTACQAAVGTTIELDTAEDASLHVAIHLRGDAAAVIDDDLDRQLTELAVSYLPDPSRHDGDDQLTISSPVDYPDLQAASALTGIDTLTLTPDPEQDGHTTLQIDYAAPTALTDAITGELASQPDAAALTAAILATTYIETTVIFPGGIDDTTAPPTGTLDVDGTTATYRQPLHDYTPGTLTLTGDTSAPPSPLWLLPLLLALPLAAWKLTRPKAATPGR